MGKRIRRKLCAAAPVVRWSDFVIHGALSVCWTGFEQGGSADGVDRNKSDECCAGDATTAGFNVQGDHRDCDDAAGAFIFPRRRVGLLPFHRICNEELPGTEMVWAERVFWEQPDDGIVGGGFSKGVEVRAELSLGAGAGARGVIADVDAGGVVFAGGAAAVPAVRSGYWGRSLVPRRTGAEFEEPGLLGRSELVFDANEKRNLSALDVALD